MRERVKVMYPYCSPFATFVCMPVDSSVGVAGTYFSSGGAGRQPCMLECR
jgi:hypothetical protein